MFAAFPVHIFLLVKGKYDGFVLEMFKWLVLKMLFFSFK